MDTLLTLDCYGFITSSWPVIPFSSDEIQYSHIKSIHVCSAHNRSGCELLRVPQQKPVIYGRLTHSTASTDTMQTLKKMKQDLDADIDYFVALVRRSFVFSLFLWALMWLVFPPAGWTCGSVSCSCWGSRAACPHSHHCWPGTDACASYPRQNSGSLSSCAIFAWFLTAPLGRNFSGLLNWLNPTGENLQISFYAGHGKAWILNHLVNNLHVRLV